MTDYNNGNTFIYYASFFKQVQRIEKAIGLEAAYNLQRCIVDYGLNNIVPEEDNPAWIYGFEQIKAAIDAAQKRYTKTIENGKRGGAPKKEIPIDEILSLQAEGYTQKQIANELGISTSTVKRRLDEYKQERVAQDNDQLNYNATQGSNGSSNDSEVLNQGVAQKLKKVLNHSEPILNHSELVLNSSEPIQNPSSKAQFSQNLNKNKNKNKDMNKNMNKNNDIISASRADEPLIVQNPVVKKSSSVAQNFTTSFELLEDSEEYEEKSSLMAQNLSCNFELNNEPEIQFHFEPSIAQNHPGGSDPIMAPPPIDKEVLDKMKYNKDYLLQDGLIVVIETGEVFTIPRT